MSEHLKIEQGFPTDCRKSWFMQQHFSPEELQQLYEYETQKGKVAKIVNDKDGWKYFHILDTENKIDLCRMDNEEDLRAWMNRQGYVECKEQSNTSKDANN